MREYARLQTAILLRRFAFQVGRAASSGDAEAIHDIRVAIRRLSRCLRTFHQFYPDDYWKRIRRQLSAIMDAAGAVRDRDIALELLAAAGVSQNSAIAARLHAERREAATILLRGLRRWKSRNLSRRWRTRLEL